MILALVILIMILGTVLVFSGSVYKKNETLVRDLKETRDALWATNVSIRDIYLNKSNNQCSHKEIITSLDNVPNKVLESITGSVSQSKGKLAELIAYINLKANYDRVIPLGSIVDFIMIQFPKGDLPGKLVFADIKNGSSARLSADQKMLKKIIDSHNIEFIKIKIATEEVNALEALAGEDTLI